MGISGGQPSIQRSGQISRHTVGQAHGTRGAVVARRTQPSGPKPSIRIERRRRQQTQFH